MPGRKDRFIRLQTLLHQPDGLIRLSGIPAGQRCIALGGGIVAVAAEHSLRAGCSLQILLRGLRRVPLPVQQESTGMQGAGVGGGIRVSGMLQQLHGGGHMLHGPVHISGRTVQGADIYIGGGQGLRCGGELLAAAQCLFLVIQCFFQVMAGLITQGQVIQRAGVFCGIFRSGCLIAGQRLLKKLLRTKLIKFSMCLTSQDLQLLSLSFRIQNLLSCTYLIFCNILTHLHSLFKKTYDIAVDLIYFISAFL